MNKNTIQPKLEAFQRSRQFSDGQKDWVLREFHQLEHKVERKHPQADRKLTKFIHSLDSQLDKIE